MTSPNFSIEMHSAECICVHGSRYLCVYKQRSGKWMRESFFPPAVGQNIHQSGSPPAKPVNGSLPAIASFC